MINSEAEFSNNKKFVQSLFFSMSEAALFPRKLASHFWFFYTFFAFYVGSGSNSGSGTVMHSGSGSATAKRYVSSGSGSSSSFGSSSGSSSGSTTLIPCYGSGLHLMAVFLPQEIIQLSYLIKISKITTVAKFWHQHLEEIRILQSNPAMEIIPGSIPQNS